jgi:gamma-glutamyltranspeptidase / glutathione hydrolase
MFVRAIPLWLPQLDGVGTGALPLQIFTNDLDAILGLLLSNPQSIMSLTEKFSLTQYPYPSQRQIVLGNQRAVATSQPLATLAGMEMFWAGGNAVDAALAMAIALTIVEPTSNGIGGDAFALVWDGKLHGLNASGCSPQNLTLATLAGRNRLPKWGWLPVTVPGAVSAWRTLRSRWGKLPFEQLFAPAIRYAESGFPFSPVTAAAWQRMEKIYLPLQGREFQAFQEVFFPGNRSPKVGEIWRSQAHAETLKAIASEKWVETPCFSTALQARVLTRQYALWITVSQQHCGNDC